MFTKYLQKKPSSDTSSYMYVSFPFRYVIKAKMAIIRTEAPVTFSGSKLGNWALLMG